MDRTELVNLQQQIKEEFETIKPEFEQFCDSNDCCLVVDFDNEAELYEMLLDGKQYDELDADIQNLFFFCDGQARRKFDGFRNKAGILCRLYKKINHFTKEVPNEDDIFFAPFEVERLMQASEQIIAEEQAFLTVAKRVLTILESLPEK